MNKTATYSAILLCGGQGSRLAELTGGQPKSLFELAGQPLIQYSTASLPPHAVAELVFVVGVGADKLRQWVETAHLPQRFICAEQTLPDVLGAIVSGVDHTAQDRFIICNTDEVRQGLDVHQALRCHEQSNALATMVVTQSDNLHRHRLVSVRHDGLITGSQLKPEAYKLQPHISGLVNTGFLILERQALSYAEPNRSTDWSGLIDPLCEAGQLNAYINPNIAYFNVGTPVEYHQAAAYLKQYPGPR